MRRYLANFFIISLFIFLLSSCATQEYYKSAAVDKARNYIFEQVPKMSPQNAAYVKYSYPRFETAPIYTTTGTDDISNYYWKNGDNYYNPVAYSRATTYSQTAIVWDLASPKVSLIVVGACSDTFRSWEPYRLLVTPLVPRAGTSR